MSLRRQSTEPDGHSANSKPAALQGNRAAGCFYYAIQENGGENRVFMLPGDGRFAGESLAADGCEACLEVGDDVVDVLGADGQADGVLVDLLLGQLRIGQLAVGGGSRMDD